MAGVGVAAGAVGWLLGAAAGPSAAARGAADPAEAAEVRALRAEVARLEGLLEEAEPALAAASVAAAARPPDAATGANGAMAPPAGEAAAAFAWLEAGDPEEAVRLFLAWCAAALARGLEGHLELLRVLDAHLTDPTKRERIEALVGSEEEAVRLLYPVLRFAVLHDQQVADLLETTLETMAERPSFFAEMEDDTLELFTEGIGMAMPGVVDEARLARMRAHAVKVLEAPEAGQPRAIQRNRRRLEGLLRAWVPPLAPEEALARLRAGDVQGEEVLALLRRVPPELRGGLDLEPLLGPLVETGSWRALRELERLEIDASTRAALDRRVTDAARLGRADGHAVGSYLRATGRDTFAKALPFLDAGLTAGGRAPDAMALAAMRMPGGPESQEWLRGVRERYDLSEGVRNLIDARAPR
jgi:hypothetical protein